MGRIGGAVLSLLAFSLMLMFVFTMQTNQWESERVEREVSRWLFDVCQDRGFDGEDVCYLKDRLSAYEIKTCVLRKVDTHVRLREWDAMEEDQILRVGDEVVVECIRYEPTALIRLIYALDLHPEGELLEKKMVVQALVN